jgi:hypothetical protein
VSTNYRSNLGSTFFACLDDLLEKASFLTVSSSAFHGRAGRPPHKKIDFLWNGLLARS